MIGRVILVAVGLGVAPPAVAADVSVAVAANFTAPAKEIAVAFAQATGHRAILSFGASGGLATQAAHGAPFAVLLSADADRPRDAEAAGYGVTGTRFTYAVGRLVLYSADPTRVDARGRVLATGRFARLAIADPATAPYGRAAIETLRTLRVDAAVAPKIVKGASIAQAYQFVASGAAELGFVAASEVVTVRGGSRWLVPERLHAPIEQQAILLRPGARDPAAKSFLAFLRSPPARAIIRRYGYGLR